MSFKDDAFEVSAEGVLLSCHSVGYVAIPEGVKFIDTECKFAHAEEIEVIKLPKSFLGYQESYDSQLAFDYDPKRNKIASLVIGQDLFSKAVKDGHERYYFLTELGLPFLQGYEVEKGNPIYTSKGGLLYSKCESLLLDIPESYVDDLYITENFKYGPVNLRNIIKQRNLDITYIGEHLSLGALNCIASLMDQDLYTFRALDASSIDEIPIGDLWDERVHKVCCVFPQLSFKADDSSNTAISAALGVLVEPQLYSEEMSSECLIRLLRMERKIYGYGLEDDNAMILEFYRNMWKSKDMPAVDRKAPYGAYVYLIEAIVRGNLADVKRALKSSPDVLTGEIPWLEDVNCAAHAMALALRYGGYEKLERLLSNGAISKLLKAKVKKGAIKVFIESSYYLWCSDYLFHCHRFAPTTLHIDKESKEIRGYSPLSEDEILKCLQLLSSHKALTPEDQGFDLTEQRIAFLALLAGQHKIYEYMRDRGVSITQFIKDRPKMVDEFDTTDIIDSAVPGRAQGIVDLLEVIASEGGKFAMSHQTFLEFAKYAPEHFAKSVGLMQVKASYLTEVFTTALEDHEPRVVEGMIKSKTIKSYTILERFIEMAKEAKDETILAMLVDYQKGFVQKTRSKKTAGA